MNPPPKPSPLHMLAVCTGLIMLFAGTWTLVKKASPAPDAQHTPSSELASTELASTAKPPAPTAEPKPTSPSPPPTTPTPNAAPPSTPDTPSPDATLSMRVPDAPSDLSPETPKPQPQLSTPAPPEPKLEATPAKKTNNEIAGPIEYQGPPSPEHQPSPIPIAANIDPKAPPYPPAAEMPTQMPAATPEADKNKITSKDTIKDVTDSKASHHDMEAEPEDGPVTQPKGTLAEKTTNIKPTTSSALPGWELLRYASRDYVSANSIHRFYRFTNLKVDGKNVWFTSPQLVMKAYIGSHELLINNIKFVMSYPVIELNNKPCFSRLDLCKLIDPVLRPSYINNTKPFDTVVIDPGHGGSDGGARGIYGHEKDFALKLAILLKRALEQRGLKVVMTRSTDVFVSLPSRVAIANKTPNSIYISLHYNSGGSSATGIETFALTPQGGSSIYGSRSVDALAFQGNQLDSQNIALATAVHAGVIDHFKFVDRGVKRARWRVLTTLQRPGILFEGGFVTNPKDGRLIAADNYRQEMANTIAQSIINYRNALNPRRASSR